MRERTQGRRVLETVAAVLPDQFRWTADTNCFSGLNRAVLSFARSFSSLPLTSPSHLSQHPRRLARAQGSILHRRRRHRVRLAVSSLASLSSFRSILTAALSSAACRFTSTNSFIIYPRSIIIRGCYDILLKNKITSAVQCN